MPDKQAMEDGMLDAPSEPWQAALSVPPVGLLVLLGERITLSLLGPGGKHRHLTITEEQTAGVIGWLALRGKGVWVRRQEVMQALGAQDDETITRQLSRLNTALNRAVQQMLPPTTNAAGEPSLDRWERQLTLIDVAEDGRDGREPCWRLSVVCDVAFFPEVLFLSQRVRQEQRQATRTLLTSDALHAACHRMMEQYGKGLFARYQQRQTGSSWSWARDASVAYRDQCLSVLEYAANREWNQAREKTDHPAGWSASIRRVAHYAAWMVDVAQGMIPDLAQAERALWRCLKMYRLIGDLSSARTIYQTYARTLMERETDWKPSRKIRKAWSEATALA